MDHERHTGRDCCFGRVGPAGGREAVRWTEANATARLPLAHGDAVCPRA